MPLFLKKGDITKLDCDAIVNASDINLSGSGEIDRMIHEAAGPELAAECRKAGSCAVGDAVITNGYKLNARYVIHTAGPVRECGSEAEKLKLRACYESCLRLAEEHGCRTVAFPLISAGTFGFSTADAMLIAKNTIEDFLVEHDMTVWLVAYRSHTYNLGIKLFCEVSSFVERSFVGDYSVRYSDREVRYSIGSLHSNPAYETAAKTPKPGIQRLDDMLKVIDEGFAEMLMRKIKEKGISNAECYNKALVTKSVFSKIKNNPDYKPTKPTVAGFVVALELPINEAKEMLGKAGYSLSHSSRFDIILEWFITNGIYDVFLINEVLLDYDQLLIGF